LLVEESCCNWVRNKYNVYIELVEEFDMFVIENNKVVEIESFKLFVVSWLKENFNVDVFENRNIDEVGDDEIEKEFDEIVENYEEMYGGGDEESYLDLENEVCELFVDIDYYFYGFRDMDDLKRK
jgi:nitrous oxide reductase